jgi:phage shock protein A
MWKRFVRAIKSLFGGLIHSIEDPKLILEQNIRELNDQVPRMNENIATVKANVVLLQKEQDKYTKSIAELTSKIKSAINAGRDDIAETYALQLEKNREQITVIEDQLEFAQKAYEKALQVKKIFMREKDRKIREAREALRANERAAWQAKIADTLEQFEVGGLDQTHDEMITRLNEKSARNEARMEIALDSIDTKAMEIEVDAERIRAGELVKQFKMEMNAEPGEQAPLLKSQTESEVAESGKSIGKNRTR